MLTILHYLPHMLFSGLAVLALAALFSDDDRKKRAFPERVRQHHYRWDDRSAHRD